jgi:putative tricarboxylic transport membrane protein
MMLSGLGVALAREAQALPAGADPATHDDAPFELHDWRTLGLFAGLLALYIALFLPLGFILCSTLLIVGGAWVLGSHAWRRDLIAGVTVSLVAYLVFTALLGLELPAGPLEMPLRLLRPGASTG